MSLNRYPSRNGPRYNTQGRFVPATQPPENSLQGKTNFDNQEALQGFQYNIPNTINQLQPQQKEHLQQQAAPQAMQDMKVEKDNEQGNGEMETNASQDSMDTNQEDAVQRLPWMKPKLPGVKKLSNKERRRRQNQTLRRLLTPKNALMVLNEIDNTGDNNFSVQPVFNTSGQYFKQSTNSFCAALFANGNTYKGYGENKMTARNAAAEQAVRDLLLKRMNTLSSNDTSSENSAGGDCPMDEDLPMIQLASFALHKLFSEWECQGHRVPQLRTQTGSISDTLSDAGTVVPSGPRTKVPKEPRSQLPSEAAAMHPCMLLSHMRPGLVYREVGVEGDCPQNFMFTMEVSVDGVVYSGKAGSKREARKCAARTACQAVFGARFNDDPK